jgi:hypothetical protein
MDSLFGTGTAVLSWLLEIFGEHEIDIAVEAALLLLALTLLATYWRHARQAPYPLLQLALFRVPRRALLNTSEFARLPIPARQRVRAMTAALGLTLELGLARGFVRALGGVTQKDIADIVRGLAVAGPPGPVPRLSWKPERKGTSDRTFPDSAKPREGDRVGL